MWVKLVLIFFFYFDSNCNCRNIIFRQSQRSPGTEKDDHRGALYQLGGPVYISFYINNITPCGSGYTARRNRPSWNGRRSQCIPTTSEPVEESKDSMEGDESRESSDMDCKLPAHPRYGRFVIRKTKLESAELILRCRDGYKASSYSTIACENGVWRTSKLPYCIVDEDEIIDEGDSYEENKSKEPGDTNQESNGPNQTSDGPNQEPDNSMEDGNYGEQKTSSDTECDLPEENPSMMFDFVVEDLKDIISKSDKPNSRSVVVKVKCKPGYTLEGVDKVYCFEGSWLSSFPECKNDSLNRFSEIASNGSTIEIPGVAGESDKPIQTMCVIPETDPALILEVNNNKSVPAGTVLKSAIIKASCQLGYKLKGPDKIYCIGKDLILPTCEMRTNCRLMDDCGIRDGSDGLLAGGRAASVNTAPWTALLYCNCQTSKICKQDTCTENIQDYAIICGGSIINQHFVLTAAHCVSPAREPEEFAIAAGKLHSRWLIDEEGTITQKRNLSSIAISQFYGGKKSNYAGDIAILKVDRPFRINTYVKAVCLSMGCRGPSTDDLVNKNGLVTGLGWVDRKGKQPNKLQFANLPYVDPITCKENATEDWKNFITHDKFCAGSSNGTAVCRGDSGGGLVFPVNENKYERYYLRGIVSISPRHDKDVCNVDSWASFTNVAHQMDFIIKALS